MNDLLGRLIKKDDIVLINKNVYKVVSSYSKTLKYKGTSSYIMSTSMNEKILVISDFDPSYIETILSNNIETIEKFQEETLSPKVDELEIKRQRQLENKAKLELKKQTKVGSLIKDKCNSAFIYLGKSLVQSKMLHTYYYFGYMSFRQSFKEKKEYIKNMVFSSYNFSYTSTLKIPDIISNYYNDEIIKYFKDIDITQLNPTSDSFQTIQKIQEILK